MTEQDSQSIVPAIMPRWFEDLRPGGAGEGFLECGLHHSLIFVRRPINRLIVTFDNLSNVGDRSPEREPWAFKFAQDINVSHLGVMAHSALWYRDPDLIARFRKLADDGFFSNYDRVLFAGVSMGGFASVAFASLVPGAHVVSVNPQTTLDPDLVPWETRYETGRRQDWTLPLSDAAAVTGGLGRVNVFYDPYHELDRRHVGRFAGDNIQVFHCRHSNHKTAVFLRKIGALKPVMEHCLFDELTELEFYRLYRGRRDLRWYKGAVSAHFTDSGRDDIANAFGMAFRKRLRRIARQKDMQIVQDDGLSEAELPQTTPVEKDVEDDAPATAGRSGRPMGARDNSRCAIVTTMKNEGPFMLEWVAYNRSIGFTDFLIFTNDCADGTDKIAMRLQELGLAVHIDNRFKPGASPQRVALRRTLQHQLYQEADWIICADCDEFLNVRAGEGCLPDLFEAVGPADAISFCWKLFGCGDQITYKDRFIHEHFTWSAPELFREKYRGLGLKTLFRPSEAIQRFGVHRPKFDGQPAGFVWKDAGGQPMPDKYFETGWSAHGGFSHTHARLHHYAVRSIDSFLVKRDRGRTNHVTRDQGVAYWADMNLNMEQDTSLLPAVERTRVEYDRMLKDPELARLHAEACAWHSAKITALKSNKDWSEFHAILQTINQPGEAPVDKGGLEKAKAAS